MLNNNIIIHNNTLQYATTRINKAPKVKTLSATCGNSIILVVPPLIALMKDQVGTIQKTGYQSYTRLRQGIHDYCC